MDIKIKTEAVKSIFSIFVTYYLVRPILFSAIWLTLLPGLRQPELLSEYLVGFIITTSIAMILTLILMNTTDKDGCMIGMSVMVMIVIYITVYNLFCDSLALNELLYQSQNRKSAVVLAWFLEVLGCIATVICCGLKLRSYNELNGLVRGLTGLLSGSVFLIPALYMIYIEM